MGETYVTVSIRNPADLDRCWEGLFRVDTGAFDSLVPGPHLDAIGLKPEGTRVYELADGTEMVMDITGADIEFMGEIVGGTIRYGAPDAEPLLGLAALASVGIEVDPASRRLKRRPAVRLKGLGTYPASSARSSKAPLSVSDQPFSPACEQRAAAGDREAGRLCLDRTILSLRCRRS